MSKKTTLTEKTSAELTKLLAEKREELRKLRFVAVGGRPKDSDAPKKTRKEIARVLTEQAARTKNA